MPDVTSTVQKMVSPSTVRTISPLTILDVDRIAPHQLPCKRRQLEIKRQAG
jgi:hypothetical protein